MITQIRLRRWRRSRDIPLRSMAALIGITYSYLSRLERGKQFPSDEVAARIQLVTGVRKEGWKP